MCVKTVGHGRSPAKSYARSRAETFRCWLQNMAGLGRQGDLDTALPARSVGFRTQSEAIEALATNLVAVF